MRMKTALALYLALSMMLPGCAAAVPDREQAEEIAAQAADQQVPAVQEEDPAPQSVPQPWRTGPVLRPLIPRRPLQKQKIQRRKK